MEQLMARLAKQQGHHAHQKARVESSSEEERTSSPTDPYGDTQPTESVANSDGRPDAAEVFRLNKELELTRQRMAQMEVELTQSRITQHTVEQAIGSPFPAAQQLAFNVNGQGMVPPQNGMNGRASPFPTLNQPMNGIPGNLRVDTGMAASFNGFQTQL